VSKKKRKIRAEFRKGHDTRRRVGDLTRHYRQESEESHDDLAQAERVSGKGELTRKRTIVGKESVDDEASFAVQIDVDSDLCRPGRVIAVYGLSSVVHDENGDAHRCATRGLLKSLSTDQRHVVAAGDQVWFLPVSENEGIIERVEPRRGVLSRSSRGRQHVIVTNVDQLLIIASAAEPSLKPNLIDRFLVTAEKSGIDPVICINKIDLVEPADLQPLIGVYGQMGYQVLVVSAQTGFGMDRFQQVLKDKESVVAGQSGVGKSSLLNAVDENLELRVRAVSEENQKGRHTTTAAQLLPLTFGGYVVDTPGIRQFQLWDVIPEEVSGFFRDLRPYASLCRFPNCTHTHEDGCAVKDAVADGKLDARRYESFCYLCEGDDA
jgi:ribosome biogenesis GTPase